MPMNGSLKHAFKVWGRVCASVIKGVSFSVSSPSSCKTCGNLGHSKSVEKGVMLRNPGLVLGRWAWFFGTLLNAKSDKLRLDIIEELRQWPITYTLVIEPTENELMGALKSMANVKVVGPDEVLVELLKLRPNHHPTVLQKFHPVIKLVWHSYG